MKTVTLILAAAAFLPLTGLAADPERFVCGAMGYHTLSVQFAGPRYMDSLELAYLGEDFKPLLAIAELGKGFSNESVHVNLTFGSCVRGPGDLLISCRVKPGSISLMNYEFQTYEKLSDDFGQSTTISRQGRLDEVDLEIRRDGDQAKLKLRMKLDTFDKKGLDLRIEKQLGSLKQDWFMCRFE